MFFNEEGQIDDEYQTSSEEEEEGQFMAQSNGSRHKDMNMENIASYKEMMMAHMNAAAAGGKQIRKYYEDNEEEEEEEYWEVMKESYKSKSWNS